MDFSFSEEQIEFRDVLRRFLGDVSPADTVRALMETDSGYDPAVWKQMGQDLGLMAVAIPEAYGGQGFGLQELALVSEEMGRSLLCAPYFASVVMGANAILNVGDEAQKRDLLPGIASGETIATFAVAEDSGQWNADGVTLTATPDGDGFRLEGHKSFVLDGCIADLIVVAARLPGSSGRDGIGFFTVAKGADGLDATPLAVMDPTRKQARLNFTGVMAAPLGTPGDEADALDLTLRQAAMCLANEMVGGAEQLRESAQEYLDLRVQFGRKIGSFQSIKHKAADMLLDVEMAKSAAYTAAEALAEGADGAAAYCALAKATAADTYLQTAITTIQMHGGIGFTWDNDTHLWFKRAKSSEVFLGSPSYHRALMLQHWQD